MGRTTARIGVIGVAIGVVFAGGTGRAGAQSEAARTSTATETAGLLDLSPASLFVLNRGLALPSNLVAPANYQDLLQRLWVRSATFRRQCARIEAAPTWRVVVIPAQSVKPGTRADTRITRKDGGGVASVNLMPQADLIELIGHEMEHIIEQLDGVDLPRCAKRHLHGVVDIDGLRYETSRAVAVGRLVAEEFRRHGGAL